jgi:hypothetical protein
MKTKKTTAPVRRVLVVLATYLAAILIALLLGVTHQIAGWVAQIIVALSLLRLAFLFGWGAGRNGWRWRV